MRAEDVSVGVQVTVRWKEASIDAEPAVVVADRGRFLSDDRRRVCIRFLPKKIPASVPRIPIGGRPLPHHASPCSWAPIECLEPRREDDPQPEDGCG